MHFRSTVFLFAIFAICAFAGAQMLANPGWKGNGFQNNMWWRRAIIYRAAPLTSEVQKQLEGSLDRISSTGVDAILVEPQSDNDQALDALSDLSAAASRRHVRIIASLRITKGDSAAEVLAKQRRMLHTGISGLEVDLRQLFTALPQGPGAHELARAMRQQFDQLPGEHVLIAKVNDACAGNDWYGAKGDEFQLLICNVKRVEGSPAKPVAVEAEIESTANDQVYAAELLTQPYGVVLPANAFANDAQTLDWYRKLINLHALNNTIRNGKSIRLLQDGEIWMISLPRPSRQDPPLVVACNSSSKTVTYNVTGEIHKAGARGTFLRAILRNDGGMGGLGLDAVRIAPHSVFIGEVKF